MDDLDELELWECLASEIELLSQHRDILGDGYLELLLDDITE